MLPVRFVLKRLSQTQLQRFAGVNQGHEQDHKIAKQNDHGHGHDHGHSDGHGHEIPQLDLNQHWIKTSQFSTIEGFQDLHLHEHHEEQDPYAHLRGKSIFSFERLFFPDPYYTPDDQEGLMNLPHGYLTNDNPMDTANSYDIPGLELAYIGAFAIGLGLLYGIHGLEFRSPGSKLYEDNYTAELLEDEIRRIRVQNQQLEERRDELKSKLES